ncbi:pyrroloquinoline quinone biosynthesis protein PqqB [Streptomyces yaizuensis]|uniref:Coenzyme PQQ synthesis protein B n=1 Tax=Streptomyces yaizuensis TaxID=2989713 RepID=A0ABQ5P6V9_9ACTN|nr:MBL fold metallo-hydrolase [Streptomyces sp. YSPA8]GLF98306.1 pyrroloquinoline quinone biosynthesis protein PqqB [Streptomyces sp. YSPA8]
MLLQVLGTAAGGGLPQWNCACPGCTGARAHPHRRRRHASLALRAGDGRWYLVNATPDIGDQIEDTPALRPGPGPRQTPVAGILLTDAELDHTLGIARLREADGFDVLATRPVRHALLDRLRLGTTLAPYTSVRWNEFGTGPRPLAPDSGIEVQALPVSAKRPRYAADLPPDAPGQDAWVSALLLRSTTTGRRLLYAPALARWSDTFQRAAETADCVIVDGTFWDDDEPVRTGISHRTATGMGHLPITGPNGTAHRLGRLPGRGLYTHLNNTNPLGDPDAPQHRLLRDQGLEVAADRMVIEL